MLGRPGAEELAVALDQSITFELRKTHTVFIDLVFPHASDSIGLRISEALDHSCVSLEMVVERCPMSSGRQLHWRFPHPFCPQCTKVDGSTGCELGAVTFREIAVRSTEPG